jgi:hypothetical protein
MIEHWKGYAVQVVSGTYIVASTLWGQVDATLKAVLGVTMIVLCWHQIISLRNRKHRIDRLEELLRQSKIRCERAANGLCWMQDEADRELDKGARP